jgi:serine O-acetyltransferase
MPRRKISGYMAVRSPEKSEFPMTFNSIQTSSAIENVLSQLFTPSIGHNLPAEQGPLPSWTATASLLEELHALLLMTLDPGDAKRRLFRVMHIFESQSALCITTGDISTRVSRLGENFLEQLPAIKRTLQGDTEAALQGDPAVTLRDEIILAYPGLRALTYYRIAHALYKLDVPLLPRLITEIGHSVTGIDIHPGAKIGKRFFIDHGTGVVIGATCIIGNDVKIYQGVTLGARSFPKSGKGQIIKGLERHPIIGDRVTIYAAATILGRVHIGSDSVIGGNVWITKDIPAKSNVMQHRPTQEKFIHGAGI